MVSNCKHLILIICLRNPYHIQSAGTQHCLCPQSLFQCYIQAFTESKIRTKCYNVSAVTVYQRGCPVTTPQHETSHFSTWFKAFVSHYLSSSYNIISPHQKEPANLNYICATKPSNCAHLRANQPSTA